MINLNPLERCERSVNKNQTESAKAGATQIRRASLLFELYPVRPNLAVWYCYQTASTHRHLVMISIAFASPISGNWPNPSSLRLNSFAGRFTFSEAIDCCGREPTFETMLAAEGASPKNSQAKGLQQVRLSGEKITRELI
jgi:hypothetical protein